MSVSTRLQAMQPTDLGIPGPTSLDMARAFRSVRADPLSFLVRGLRAVRRPRRLPRPGRARAAGQRPRRRPARAADLRAALGQADRAVRRAGPGHRARPARVVRARLDRAPSPRRARPSTTSGSRPWATRCARPPSRRSPRGWRRLVRRRRPGRRRRAHPPHRARRRRSGALLRRPVRAGAAAAGRDQRRGRAGRPAGAVDPAHGRVDPDADQPAAARDAAPPGRDLGRARSPSAGRAAVLAPAPTATTSSACSSTAHDRRGDPPRAGHHGHRRPRDRGRGAGLDADAAGRGPARAGPGARRAGGAPAGPVSLLGHRSTLPWTRAVVDEALRLFPPAWALSRRSQQADVIGGREVPAGTLVIISPWLLHRRADVVDRPAGLPPGALPRRRDGAPGGLPALRAGAAAVHRARVRAGRDGAGAERAAARPPVSVPPGWTRPAAQAQVAVHPRGRHAARRHPRVGRMADAWSCVVLLAAAGRARWLLARPADGPARGARRDRVGLGVGRRPGAGRGGHAARAAGVVAAARGRPSPRSWWSTTAPGTRPPRSPGPGAPPSCPRRPRRPAGPARRGPATSAPTTTSGDLLLFLDADTVLAPDALDGLLELHDAARRAGVGAALPRGACAPTSSCRRTST